jgi:hypothetical protein
VIEIFDGDDAARLAAVLSLRRAAFEGSRRDPAHLDAWQSDVYDRDCRHVLMTDEAGAPLAAVRVILDGRWPLQDRYDGPMEQADGAEFGRLCVLRRETAGVRTLYELMVNAARYCVELGRPMMYGLTVAPFWRSLARAGVPLTPVSGPIEAYGEEENVILFDARDLVAFYDSWRSRQTAAPQERE